MSFPTDDIYLGPKSFGPRKGTEGIIWHTTESAGMTRTAAVGTANWQKTNPGSYNWIIYDGGLLLTVPYLEASGGTNPASAAWAPGRYPWLKSMLSAAAYADPNAYLLNVAFAGRTADLLAGAMPASMYITAAKLTRWVEQQTWGKDDAVFSGHMHWQSNRSDPGQPTIDRILTEYARLYSAPTTPPPAPDYQALYVAEQAKVSDLAGKLSAERSVSATLAARITAAKVALG